MGGKEKVPRPASVTQSGQEANKNRVTKAAGVWTGKRDQTKRAKAERATVLQEKEERFKSTINIILDEGHKKGNGVRVTGPHTAVTVGLVDATKVSSIPVPQPTHGFLAPAHPDQRQPPLPGANVHALAERDEGRACEGAGTGAGSGCPARFAKEAGQPVPPMQAGRRCHCPVGYIHGQVRSITKQGGSRS